MAGTNQKGPGAKDLTPLETSSAASQLPQRSLEPEILIDAIKQIAEERLTQKQRFILQFIASAGIEVNVTQLVSVLKIELSCSASAVWNNLNSLKRAGLVTFGSKESKGEPVRLTSIGMEVVS